MRSFPLSENVRPFLTHSGRVLGMTLASCIGLAGIKTALAAPAT